MKTEYLSPQQIERAAELLTHGRLVAFPTETVYGLGANALNATAVESIFIAKGRPSDNPLIVHIHRDYDLLQIVTHVSDNAARLMARFWPGPLTLVFNKRDIIPSVISARLSTVAVRMPAELWCNDLLKIARCPVAAPSANRSGRPSATTWQSVAQDLDGRIDAIVCGPATRFGLESTVVDATGSVPVLLRHGGVSLEELRGVCPDVKELTPAQSSQSSESNLQGINSPGLRHRHYQPAAQVIVCDASQRGDERSAFIGITTPIDSASFAIVQQCADVNEYASRVFEFFREMDRQTIERIYCERVPDTGIGRALNDRLNRASQ